MSDQAIPVFSANTEEQIGTVPRSGPDEVDRAVAGARAAFDDPKGWQTADRADALRSLATAMDARIPENARLVSEQNGMPIALSTNADAPHPGRLLRYYADLLDGPLGETEETRGTTLIRSVPLGVVGAIAPWNFPNTMAALKYAPALAAGCTVVLKPSPETSLDARLLTEAIQDADLPPGVLTVLPGDAETGALLVEHPGIDKVSFTGSTAVGHWIGEVSGRLLRPTTLELGGKSAAIVLDDADLDLAKVGAALTPALFGNNGQTCFVSSRVLAPRTRYDEVVEAIATLAASLTVGNSLEPATRIGPLVSAAQRRRVEGYIAQGKASGGRLVTGGGRPAHLPKGWFVEPTVFADVDNGHPIAREEIFGPVITITPYDSDDDAVRVANDSEYGLAGTVWTEDPERGLAIAKQVVTGSFGINRYQPDTSAPSTMTKASGLGTKFGPEALTSYRRFQSVYL